MKPDRFPIHRLRTIVLRENQCVANSARVLKRRHDRISNPRGIRIGRQSIHHDSNRLVVLQGRGQLKTRFAQVERFVRDDHS